MSRCFVCTEQPCETFANTSCLVFMVEVGTSLLGILIICWTLREVFTDLFQPSASGSLSSFVSRKLFELGKRARWMLGSAGPLSIVVVIFTWVVLISVGFALLFWGKFPSEFTNTSAEPQDSVGRFWSVLYFSLTALSTLGSTTFSPKGDWLRILASFEAIIGFSLVTASITWIVLLYPALGRVRALARRVSTLSKAQKQTGVDLVSADPGMLADLGASVLRARVDFIHFPLIYYFQADAGATSMGWFLLELEELARRASAQDQVDGTRLGAALLTASLHELAEVLARKFVPGSNADEPRSVFHAVAKDHLESES
ncbi:MAG: two pore domain potassium channel family protein [Acidobacteriaceae bacterium]|nr:two pore domain potassium channel family protein [Acidobacteriaceae bacterium]